MKAWTGALAALVFVLSCSSDEGDAQAPAAPASADLCDPDNAAPLRVRFDPPTMVLAPGASRPARVVVDPDVCQPSPLAFVATGGIAKPDDATLDHQAEHAFDVKATAAGAATLAVTIERPSDGAEAHAELAVDVRDARVPSCDAATIAAGASVAPSDAEIRCDAALTDHAIGPAIAFIGPPASMAKPLRHELSFTVPIEPAAMPERARLRHLRVWYKGPRARTPREVSVSGPRVVKRGDAYVLAFRSPWLGTYQVGVDPDAGTRTAKRRRVHRALLGISMGAGGAATFGVRHHDMFDSIAMLGGPVDWTWLLWYVEHYALGGFCPKGSTCAKTQPDAYPLDEPFTHTMDFDHLWYEDGAGTGGIERGEYIAMLTDVTLARGNPLGQNADPALSFYGAGPKATDPFVTGGANDCLVTTDPIAGDPDEAKQREREARCNAARCDPSRTLVIESGYYDDEYNPDGTERVISFCDGSSADGAASPYKSTWAPPRPGQAVPVSFALAVDTNKNGVRDADEPVIRAGHEPWDDTGTDGVPDAQEPGYDAATNPDPNGDDYDPMIDPTGTEGDHRYQMGEPFRDVGLDGVANTKDKSAYDVGEGDGVYTEARGLSAYWEIDPWSIVRGMARDAHGALPSDDDLARLRIWTDGGVRDFLNFGRDADHFHGALAARAGARPRGATMWDGLAALPGQTPGDEGAFDGTRMLWADLPSSVGVRYGDVDATPAMIADGDGQHVGTGKQILARLDGGFHFIGQGWPDADRVLTAPSGDDPIEGAQQCEIDGICESVFTGPKSGRTAPVTVVLPPGYAHAQHADRRYPVVYVLHGYGQSESDVKGLGFLTLASMNDKKLSSVDRLPKFIVVYVDGRCRGECVAGTFFLDSDRPGGARVDTWMEELVDWVDATYRTMGPSDVDEIE